MFSQFSPVMTLHVFCNDTYLTKEKMDYPQTTAMFSRILAQHFYKIHASSGFGIRGHS